MDLTGGLDPSRDLVLAERPQQGDVRESANMWIFDDQGRFSIPRICVEAIASQWDDRGLQVNIAFPSGRALNGAGAAPAVSPIGADGRPTVFGAGPLVFECLEPFQRWSMAYHGTATDTTVQAQTAGEVDGPDVRVDVDLLATMVVPPWIQGEMSTDAAEKLAAGTTEQLFMGGARYEQLFRCEGTFKVGDDDAMPFTGTGLRIHRVGVRNTEAFWGHCWQSAVFPSGKGFGYIGFPPRPDGSPSYVEAYVFDGDRMLPAAVLQAPWMTEFVPVGGDVSVVFETAAGKVSIEAETSSSTFSPQGGSLFREWRIDGQKGINAVSFHQGGALYRWDGEETYGMIERSLPADQVHFGPSNG
jgi:hypothetical protein